MNHRRIILLARGDRVLRRAADDAAGEGDRAEPDDRDAPAVDVEQVAPVDADQWCEQIEAAREEDLVIAGVPGFELSEEQAVRAASALAARLPRSARTRIIIDREDLLRYTLTSCAGWSRDLADHLGSAVGLPDAGDARTLILDSAMAASELQEPRIVAAAVTRLQLEVDGVITDYPLASDRLLGPLLVDLMPEVTQGGSRIVASGDTGRLITRLSRQDIPALAPGCSVDLIDARVSTLARSAHLDRGEPLGIGTTLLTGLSLTDFSDAGPDGRAVAEMAEWRARMDYLGCRQAIRGRRLVLLWPAMRAAGVWRWVDPRQADRGFATPDAPDLYLGSTVEVLAPYGHVVAVLVDGVLQWSGGAQGEGTLAELLDQLPTPQPQPLAGTTGLRTPVRPRLAAATMTVAGREVDLDPAYLTHLADLVGTRAPQALRMGRAVEAGDEDSADELEFGGTIDELGGRFPEENLAQRRILAYCEQTRVAGQPECMLVGDSIRMKIRDAGGYVWPAYRRLSAHVNLRHIPHNCSGTKVHLAQLPGWVASGPDIVAINAGLHDLARNFRTPEQLPLFTELDTYAANCERILQILEGAGVGRVLWLLCTPVQEKWHRVAARTGLPRRSTRTNADIETYNAAAAAVMDRWGVPVIDLYSPLRTAGVEEVLEADGVHLNIRGANLAGGIVAEAVLATLSV